MVDKPADPSKKKKKKQKRRRRPGSKSYNEKHENKPAVLQPKPLPVYSLIDQIRKAIEEDDCQIIILSAQTGSGKSTQIPQILKKIYKEKKPAVRICQTEPRRAGASQIAARIADELGSARKIVSLRTRFEKWGLDHSLIMIQTEGTLLGALANRHGSVTKLPYDITIFDEVHESNWWLTTLMLVYRENLKIPENFAEFQKKKRKIICMSATACVKDLLKLWVPPFQYKLISLDGKSLYPVDDDHFFEGKGSKKNPADLCFYNLKEKKNELVVRTVDILYAEVLNQLIDKNGGFDAKKLGDVLVFVPGQAEIVEAIKCLRGKFKHSSNLERVVEPYLFFGQTSHKMREKLLNHGPRDIVRVIFATNVAETSLTFENVSHVVDSGVTKVMMYDPRNASRKLVPTFISRSEMKHRIGRLGRTRPGTYFAGFSKELLGAETAVSDRESVSSVGNRPDKEVEVMREKQDPELFIGDVTNALLYLLRCGVQPFNLVPDQIQKERFYHASAVLVHLGVVKMEIDKVSLRITGYGKTMYKHGDPSISWLLNEAMKYNVGDDAALIAAIVNYEPMDLVEQPNLKNIDSYDKVTKLALDHMIGDGQNGNLFNFMAFCRSIQDDEEFWGYCKANHINAEVLDKIFVDYYDILDKMNPGHNRYSVYRRSLPVRDRILRLQKLLMFAWAKNFSARYETVTREGLGFKYRGMPLIEGLDITVMHLNGGKFMPYADYVVSSQWFTSVSGAARLSWSVAVDIEWIHEVGLYSKSQKNVQFLMGNGLEKWKHNEKERAVADLDANAVPKPGPKAAGSERKVKVTCRLGRRADESVC